MRFPAEPKPSCDQPLPVSQLSLPLAPSPFFASSPFGRIEVRVNICATTMPSPFPLPKGESKGKSLPVRLRLSAQLKTLTSQMRYLTTQLNVNSSPSELGVQSDQLAHATSLQCFKYHSCMSSPVAPPSSDLHKPTLLAQNILRRAIAQCGDGRGWGITGHSRKN